MNKKMKNSETSYDQLIKSLTPKEKKEYKESYKALILSDMLIGMEQNADISLIKKHAEVLKISTNLLKKIYENKKFNLTLTNILKILEEVGYEFIIQNKSIPSIKEAITLNSIYNENENEEIYLDVIKKSPYKEISHIYKKPHQEKIIPKYVKSKSSKNKLLAKSKKI